MGKRAYYKVTVLPFEPQHRTIYVFARSMREAIKKIDANSWIVVDAERMRKIKNAYTRKKGSK